MNAMENNSKANKFFFSNDNQPRKYYYKYENKFQEEKS